MKKKRQSVNESDFYHILDQVIPGGNYKQVKDNNDRQLYLNRISIDGLEEMHKYSQDKRLYEYFEYKPFNSINDTKKYIKRLKDSEGDKAFGRKAICWFVRRIRDKKLIGTARFLNIDYNRQSIEWGYGIDPELWGRGYIFEIQEILKEYVFNKLCLNKLYGITRFDNQRTISAVLASGMKEEGIFRQYYRDYKGNYHNAWGYSQLSEDYFKVKDFKQKELKKEKITVEILTKVISNTLSEPGISIHDDMRSVKKWDSLSHINIILAIEKEIGRTFTSKEIAKSISVKNIFDIIKTSK